MADHEHPRLTGSRLTKFLEIIRSAPRDPSCGCIKLGETAKLLIAALVAEEEAIGAHGSTNGDE